MPSRSCQAGDTVFIRAVVLEAGSDMFRVVVEDHRNIAIAVWLPACEIARVEDLGALRPFAPNEMWRRFLVR